jgi:hypothetical protein
LGRLFDLEVAAPSRPQGGKAKQRQQDPSAQRPSGTPERIWQMLLEQGADPVALAALLRDGLAPSERRRAYLELVRDLGIPIAQAVWDDAFGSGLRRAPLPVGVREITEDLIGQPLVGIHVVTGELVELVASKLQTPAFTLGSEVFVTGSAKGGNAEAVLVHEALHAAQQQSALAPRKPQAPTRAAEHEVHRFLRRLGPAGPSQRLMRDRARASLAVHAALGRAPRISSQPLQLSAYEPTHEHAESTIAEGKKLADALSALLVRGADVGQLKTVLGPVEDTHSERARQVAIHLLGERHLDDGRNARVALVHKLGQSEMSRYAMGSAAQARGKSLPEGVRTDLESKLGTSLGDVRVHDDAAAARRAREHGAIAFTEGQDVYFGEGRFDPASDEGKRLLAHELVHVVQQKGAPKAGSPTVSPVGSPVEQEAERVAQAVVSGAKPGEKSLEVKERAPAGTISRDAGGGDAGGGAAGPINVSIMGQGFDIRLENATELDAGRKRVSLSQRLGPVSINEATLEMEGTNFRRGTVRATIDDGRLRGSSGNLEIGADKKIRGNLNVNINVPGAFVKNAQVRIDDTGISGRVTVAPSEFISRDFPVQASNITLDFTQSGNGLQVTMDGSATVRLDAGFANGEGTLSGILSIGPAGVQFAGTIQATVNIAGLNANVNATITWDGRTITVTAGASIPVNLPGIRGTCNLSYVDGKLSVEIPDLAFTAPQLSALHFGPITLADGKLQGSLMAVSDMRVAIPGGSVTLGAGSNIQIDGRNLTGALRGSFALGPEGTAALGGDVELSYNGASLDGSVTITRAEIPGVSVSGVTIGVTGLFTTNTFTISGSPTINLLGGMITGQWNNLAYAAGSLTGQIVVNTNIPRLRLPEIHLNVMPGWQVTASTPGGAITVDLGGILGPTSGLEVSMAIAPCSLRNLTQAFGTITLNGRNIAPASLAQYGSIEQISLTLPGEGGRYDFAAMSGSGRFRITAIPGTNAVIELTYANGQLSARGEADVNVNAIVPMLQGNLKIGYVSGQPNPITIRAENVTLSDPTIGRYVTINNVTYANGQLSGDISFSTPEVTIGPVTGRVVSGNLRFVGRQITGEAQLEARASGAGATARGRIWYDGARWQAEGSVTVDLHQATNGYMTGQLEASNEGGGLRFTGNGTFAQGPLVGVVDNISVSYVKNADGSPGNLSATIDLTVDKLQRLLPPSVTVTGRISLTVTKNGTQPFQFSGTGNATLSVGGVLTGNIAASREPGGLAFEVTIPPGGVNLNLPGARITVNNFKLRVGSDRSITILDGGTIDVNVLNGTITGTITPIVSGGSISGVTVAGNVTATAFTEASTFSFTKNGPMWSGSAEVPFKTFGGLIDPGAKMTMTASNESGFAATRSSRARSRRPRCTPRSAAAGTSRSAASASTSISRRRSRSTRPPASPARCAAWSRSPARR